jgi:hypothetical protein
MAKRIKGASKKAAKQLNEMRKKAPTKMYGKPVMKERGPGEKFGYATTDETKIPDMTPMKRTTKVGRRSLKK